MITINKDQLNKKVQSGEFKTAIIYDRMLSNSPDNLSHFERFDCSTVDELLNVLSDFCDEYKGHQFSMILKKSTGGSKDTVCLIRINLMEVGSTVESAPQMNSGFESPDEMKKRILGEMKVEFAMVKLTAERDSANAQLGELQTTSGRLGYMLENFLIAKMGGKAPAFQSLNGMNGSNDKATKEESDISEDEFAAALIKLKDMLGPETLVNIANNYDKDDPMISMIKQTVNK